MCVHVWRHRITPLCSSLCSLINTSVTRKKTSSPSFPPTLHQYIELWARTFRFPFFCLFLCGFVNYNLLLLKPNKDFYLEVMVLIFSCWQGNMRLHPAEHPLVAVQLEKWFSSLSKLFSAHPHHLPFPSRSFSSLPTVCIYFLLEEKYK